MKNILITGAAGFIGSHLSEKLIKNNKIIGIDNFDPYYDPKIKKYNIKNLLENERFIFYEKDIRDKKELTNIFNENNLDIIIHLAAKAGVRPSIKNPIEYEDVNIKGTINLLDLSKNFNIKNFIFGSSSSVYGINQKIPFSEEDRLNKQISPYATSKRSCELYTYTYHHLYKIPVTCFRFFTVYGPRQRPEMAIHKFIRLIDNGKQIEMFGDGKSKRDYTYIDDITDGIEKSIEKKFDFEIFNLGNSKVVELRYLISLIEQGLGKKAKIKQLPDQPGDVPITYADISKAKKMIGYNPKTTIEYGIEKTINWYKKNTQVILNGA
jgi:UDP-glucuronate 4-epimerase